MAAVIKIPNCFGTELKLLTCHYLFSEWLRCGVKKNEMIRAPRRPLLFFPLQAAAMVVIQSHICTCLAFIQCIRTTPQHITAEVGTKEGYESKFCNCYGIYSILLINKGKYSNIIFLYFFMLFLGPMCRTWFKFWSWKSQLNKNGIMHLVLPPKTKCKYSHNCEYCSQLCDLLNNILMLTLTAWPHHSVWS